MRPGSDSCVRLLALPGRVVDTVLLHGRGQCVLQLESTAQATAFLSHYSERPLVMNGKKLLCQRGAADISRTPVVMHRHILREVHHVSARSSHRIRHPPALCIALLFAAERRHFVRTSNSLSDQRARCCTLVHGRSSTTLSASS